MWSVPIAIIYNGDVFSKNWHGDDFRSMKIPGLHQCAVGIKVVQAVKTSTIRAGSEWWKRPTKLHMRLVAVTDLALFQSCINMRPHLVAERSASKADL